MREVRPDRHALLELDALLGQTAALRDVGNEALAYTAATGQPIRADRAWSNLYDLRNHLAHSRLPDIDEGLVRRFT